MAQLRMRSTNCGGVWSPAVLAMAVVGLAGLAVPAMPRTAVAQSPGAAPATLDSTVEAGESDAEGPRRKLVKWNEYDGPVSTLRFGYGFLIDLATYSQDQESKQQVAMKSDMGVRDFRLLARGRFKTQRAFTWSLGYMYDGSDKSWHFRQTGLMVGVPEVSGQFFFGRTKEGYSLNKIMTGYYGWTIERSTALDAFVPILADGIKYMGYSPRYRLLWNLGVFTDAMSNRESFSAYNDLVVARVGVQPILSEADKKLLHIALMAREGTPEDELIRQKSKPESYLAPNAVDTGQFPASRARTVGIEAYYRAGPWMAGTEYNVQNVSSSSAGDPVFHGGDAIVSWLITGETRPYNTTGGYFNQVSPAKSVFEGGRGAWESVLRFSYIDLDGGNRLGGKFWRVTPMVNWYLAEYLRLEMAYGYGVLYRYGVEGGTQFFQARIQTCY